LAGVAGEPLELIRAGRAALAHLDLAGQIPAHGAPVDLQVPGDRADRPTTRV
jgi:hypothetical protein